MKLANDLIFDIGAHKGEDTFFYLLKGFRVVAVEANPDLVQQMQADYAPALASGQLVIVDKILADQSFETRNFYRNKDISLWGTTRPEMVARNERSIAATSEKMSLETISLADLMGLFGVPYYLKVDIEGDDLMCIQQLSAVEANERPHYISIESEKRNWNGLRAEFDVFNQLGYDAFQVVPQHQVGLQTIPVPPREGQAVPHDYHLIKDMTGLFGRDLPNDKWLTKQQAIAEYRKIFFQYWLNGDEGILNRILTGPKRCDLQQFWDKVLGFEVGWYDTHARRQNIT